MLQLQLYLELSFRVDRSNRSAIQFFRFLGGGEAWSELGKSHPLSLDSFSNEDGSVRSIEADRAITGAYHIVYRAPHIHPIYNFSRMMLDIKHWGIIQN